MAKGEQPVYRGMVNDANRNKIGDVSLWKNQSKSGVEYLAGIIARTDGSRLRIVLFDAKKNGEEGGKSTSSDF